MCWYCGSPINDPEPIGRSLRCQDCGKDLRSCKNCRFFLPGASLAANTGSCKETSAEPQADRERANFCDWFSLDAKYRAQSEGQKAGKVDSAKAGTASASRTAFDNLFK